MSKKKDLVQIIRDNPGCLAIIDNDDWWIWRDEAHRESGEPPIATADEVLSIGSGYGSGCSYGGDILQALALIVGITVESV
jgi:hypothetical protein